MAAKVVNQNDILQIIRDSAGLIHDIIGSISGVIDISNKISSSVHDYVDILQIVYGTGKGDSLIEIIINSHEALQNKMNKLNNPFARTLIRGIFKEIKFIIRQLNWLSYKAWFNLEDGTEKILSMFQILTIIGDSINKLSFSPLTEIKLEYTKFILERLYEILSETIGESWLTSLISVKGFTKVEQSVKSLYNIVNQLNEIDWFMMNAAKNRLDDISDILEDLLSMGKKGLLLIFVKTGISTIFNAISKCVEFIEFINQKKIGLLTGLKFSIVQNVIHNTNENIFTLIKLGLKGLLIIPILPGLTAVTIAMKLIISIIQSVSDIKFLFIKKKFKIIYSSIGLIRAILNRLKHIGKVRLKYIIKLIVIKIIFNNLKEIFINASIAGLAAVIFILTAPALILGIGALILVIRLIAFISNRIGVRTILGIGVLMIITTLLLGVAINLTLLGIIALGVMKNILYIFGFLLALIPIIGAIFILGLAVSLLAIVAAPAVIGIIAMTLMVTSILIIAGLLKLLEFVELDHDKIHKNLEKVINLSKYIMTKLFDEESTDTMQEGVDDSSGFIGMLKGLLSASPLLIQALASSIFLVFTVISVLSILFIVAMFKLIENIQLDKGKILTNIGIVTSLSKDLIDLLFGGYHTETDKNGRTIIKEDPDRKKWLGRFFGGLGLLINTICTSAFLLSTFLSISLLTVIAGELKLVGNIELDKDKILNNIGIIVALSKNIIDLLFGGYHTEMDENGQTNIKEDPDRKNWLLRIFDGIGSIINTICTSAFLLSTFMSVGLLYFISNTLKSIQDIVIDRETIKTKVGEIMTACRDVMEVITSPVEDNESEPGFWSKILDSVKTVVNVGEAIGSIGYMAMSIACIGLVKLLADNLISINDINVPTDLNVKISSILTTVDGIINVINNPKQNSLYQDPKQIKKAIGTINDVFGLLETINDADFQNSIVETRLNLLDRLRNSLLEWIEMGSKTTNLNKVEHFIDKNISFLEKIDDVKFRNLRITAKLFENMAEFSETINGNFEGLAESLNEKIAPLLEELKELMDGVGKKVEKTGADTSATIFAAKSDSKLTPDEMKQQVDRQMPRASESEKMKELQKMMKKQNMKESDDETIVGLLKQIIQIMGGV